MTTPLSVTNRPRHTPDTHRDETTPSQAVTHPFVTPDNPHQDAGNPVTTLDASQDVTDMWRSVTPARDPRSGHADGAAPSRTPNRNTRTATETTCPTCGQTVLAGLDADAMAATAVINPTPLTPTQEVTEWAAGRRTYTYSPTRREIDYRDRGSLTPTDRVHATHTCPKEAPLW